MKIEFISKFDYVLELHYEIGMNREKLQSFYDLVETKFILEVERVLTILESPLLYYRNANEFIPIEELRHRRAVIRAGSKRAPEDETIILPTKLEELPENEREEVFEWIETFCIPLRGIIHKLKNLKLEDPAEAHADDAVGKSRTKTHQNTMEKSIESDTSSRSESSHEDEFPQDETQLKDSFAAADASEEGQARSSFVPDEDLDSPPSSSDRVEPEEIRTKWQPQDDTANEAKRKATKYSHRWDQKTTSDATSTSDSLQRDPTVQSENQTSLRVKRKDREIHKRGGTEKLRKLKKLLHKYGFEEKSGGKHIKMGNIPVPQHGGGRTLPKGTEKSILESARAQYLSARLDQYIAKQ